MLVHILRSIYAAISLKANSNSNNLNMPLSVQEKFLEQFREPKDDYERSYYKYKCSCQYCYNGRKALLVGYNIGALAVLPIIVYRLKKNASRIKADNRVDAVIENVPRLPNNDVIPETILNEYKSFKEIKELEYKNGVLSGEALEIHKELKKRYFWHPYFRLITVIKVSLFNMYIKEYSPKAIVFYSYENEFSGPLQTFLCEKNNTEFISYMHGEYTRSLFFAFQKYTKYYVWDKSYIKMFSDLRCKCPMEVYTPLKLRGIARLLDEKDCLYYATYYFSNESKNEAIIIKNVFTELRKYGLRCKIRPHPRYSDIQMLKNVFMDFEIEDPRDVDLSDSISFSLYSIGLNTTVLSQAYYSGKKVVVDDVSNKKLFEDLKLKGLPILDREHILLSELIENLDITHYNSLYKFYCD